MSKKIDDIMDIMQNDEIISKDFELAVKALEGLSQAEINYFKIIYKLMIDGYIIIKDGEK